MLTGTASGASDAACDPPGRNVLRLRVLTALIAAPIVLAVIFIAPTLVFATFFFALAAIGVFEWCRLAALDSRIARNVALVAFGMLAALIGASEGLLGVGLAVPFLAFASALWLAAGVWVLGYPRGSGVLRMPVLNAGLGLVLLLAAWYGLVRLRTETGGAWLVLWVLAVVWAADIGAYFAGRRWGRRKLAPAVSPGKTWEGALGGLLASIATGAALGAAVPALAPRFGVVAWGASALVVGVVSIFGDLFESALKRTRGVKDSGTLLPGHGGVLDRIDSVIAAAPMMALMLSLQAR